MKIVLIGKTNATKRNIAKTLSQTYSYRTAMPYTTAPKANNKQNDYHYISEKDYQKYNVEERINEEYINQHHYFLTPEEVEQATIVIVHSVKALDELIEYFAYEQFLIVDLNHEPLFNNQHYNRHPIKRLANQNNAASLEELAEEIANAYEKLNC